ncbi:MAG: chromate efflux transporter [Proteobacteria bacterium]|nr:chromate efflux transporter [Pseudomonadota bacterium]MBU1648959.1 chromate efflux transporter [Pseudomonadota bacterium]MBU1986390.1 chromate efflux transporter [Pseudomonadota bacterium]
MNEPLPAIVPTPTLYRLFLAFLRLGTTAFGGPAMIAYIRDLAVGRECWLAKEAFQEGVALCQTIPGATAMQVAAYVGLRVRGVRGAIASYVGFGLPAFLLMLLLSTLYARTHTLPLVMAAFSGLQALIVAVVANATLSFGRSSLTSWQHGVIALMAAALFWMVVHPVLILLLAALLGMALHSRQSLQITAGSKIHMPAPFLPLVCLIATSAAGFALLAYFSPVLAQLAMLMARIDLMAFGGGFASVPLMFHEIVELRGWLAGTAFLDGIALGQFTPGPIVITATFVGYLLHGFLGSCVATVAMFLPSLLLVIGFAPYFSRLRTSLWFRRALSGVLCSFVGLLFTVTIRFALQVHWDWIHLFLGLAALVALLKKIDILWVILVGAAVAILFV